MVIIINYLDIISLMFIIVCSLRVAHSRANVRGGLLSTDSSVIAVRIVDVSMLICVFKQCRVCVKNRVPLAAQLACRRVLCSLPVVTLLTWCVVVLLDPSPPDTNKRTSAIRIVDRNVG